MAFDLATASPEQSSGFDLSSARPAPQEGVPPAGPGTALLPGGAVVMKPVAKTRPSSGQVLQDIGVSGLVGGGMGLFAPQILGGLGAAATSSGFAPLAPVGAVLSGMGQAAQATGPALRAVTGAVSGVTGETAKKVVEAQGGSPLAAEAAGFVAGAVGPDVARLTGKLALNVLGHVAPGIFLRQGIHVAAKEIADQLQSQVKRPLTDAERQHINNLVEQLRGAPKSEWEKIAATVGGEMERGAATIRQAGESEANFVQRQAKAQADDIAARAKTVLAETNAKSAQLHNEAYRSLDAAETAARAELDAAKKSGIPRARAIEFNNSLKTDVTNKAKATIAGVGNPNQELTQIGTDLRTAATARESSLSSAASAQYRKTQKEVLEDVKKLESKGIHVDSMPAYRELVASLRAELQPGRHSPDVAAGYQKLLTQITGKESKPLSVLEQAQLELSGRAAPSPAPVSYQMIDDARRMVGEAFRGQPAEGYAAIGETALKKYYPMLSKVQKDFAGEKQAQLLDDYAASRPGLEIFVSKSGRKITGVDPKAREQFLTDPATIPTNFFRSPTQFNALADMVGGRDVAVNAARNYAANQLAPKQTSLEIESWMTTNRDFLSAVPEVRNAVLQYKNSLAAAEKTNANIDAGINKLRTQITQNTTEAQQRASGIRAGGGVQFRDLTTQAEKTVAQGQRTASQLENETKLLIQNAEKEVGNITNKAAAAADLVYAQHSAMRNVRELIERGDMARWAAVAPIIERSPEAQRGVYDAVRQVIADEATSKKALQRFNETIRPALTRFNMITTAQADDIAKQLAEISTYRATEPEKLSLMRRMVLQGLAGAAASNTSSLVGRIILPTPPNNLAPENQNALAQ